MHDGLRWIAQAPQSRSARVLVDAGLIETFTDDGRAAATSDLALGAVVSVAVPRGEGLAVSVSALSRPSTLR